MNCATVGPIDAAGNVAKTYTYGHWGNPTSSSGSVASFFGYKSSPSFESIHKFGTRWYNSKTGTFTQPDPMPAANLRESKRANGATAVALLGCRRASDTDVGHETVRGFDGTKVTALCDSDAAALYR